MVLTTVGPSVGWIRKKPGFECWITPVNRRRLFGSAGSRGLYCRLIRSSYGKFCSFAPSHRFFASPYLPSTYKRPPYSPTKAGSDSPSSRHSERVAIHFLMDSPTSSIALVYSTYARTCLKFVLIIGSSTSKVFRGCPCSLYALASRYATSPSPTSAPSRSIKTGPDRASTILSATAIRLVVIPYAHVRFRDGAAGINWWSTRFRMDAFRFCVFVGLKGAVLTLTSPA